jgi:dolichol-phosphate mannosyltransferase
MLATRHVLIGLPAYNEEIALPRLLARVESLRKSSPEPITVVLYNDGSTDATLATARAWQERVRLVILDGIVNKGLGAGLCALVDYAVANAADGDVLVVMDCDDTHDPEQIEEMLACIAEGADVVIGSRYERGALVRGVPPLRRVTALGAAALFKTIHHVRGVWDYTCGYPPIASAS